VRLAIERAMGEGGGTRGKKPSKSSFTLEELLRRPQVSYRTLRDHGHGPPAAETTPSFSFPFEAVETEVKYAGFIRRQSDQVKRVAGKMNKRIPPGIDYASVTTLRMEAREKLAKMAPTTVGQASRIGGVTPADVSSLLVHLEVGARKANAAKSKQEARLERKRAGKKAMAEVAATSDRDRPEAAARSE
jgi:tRNA uridine 5-carboxymethylaminomethyl modification enzyme